jgi:aspartyl-tRNA(Asn)/glutamyl-tRNA(Gln) amidotransferase subunit A
MATPDLRSISQVAASIRTRALSPVDLVEACLSRIEARKDTNAFITVLRERALDEARHAAKEIQAGRYLGPLHGVPVSIKDLVDVAGTPTTSGSRVPPKLATEDAPVVRRLRQAGAIVIGKTNLHEFAFGTTSDETAFGPVRHPMDPSRAAGGSSGGSGAAILDGMCFGSVGTDTGGSIRIPSAACGIVGLKPGLGEVSCDGVVPLSATLDHVGPMARTVNDAGMLYQAMKAVSVQGIAPAGGRLVFGIPRQYFFDRLEAAARGAVERTIKLVRDAGHAVLDSNIEHAHWTPDVYLHICLPEASCHHAISLRDHWDKYSPGVRLRLEMGRYLLAEDYVRAMRLKESLTKAVDRALERCDALLLATLPIPAPPIGTTTVDVDGVQAPVRGTMLSLTQLFNISGHPAVALPAGRGPEGLPRSVQLVGHRGRTERLLDIAAAVEELIR